MPSVSVSLTLIKHVIQGARGRRRERSGKFEGNGRFLKGLRHKHVNSVTKSLLSCL